MPALMHLLLIAPVRILSSACPRLFGVLMHRILFPLSRALERLCRCRLLGHVACSPAAGCPVPAEWIRLPSVGRDPKTVLLYLPGGAFVSSDATSFPFAKEILPRIARSLPEGHPVPAILVARYTIPASAGIAHAEVDAVLRWLAADGCRVVVCGASAGGTLALGAALRASKEGNRSLPAGTQAASPRQSPPALLGAVLICPWLDLTHTSPSLARNATSCLLSLPLLRVGARQFVGVPPARGAHPPSPTPVSGKSLGDQEGIPGALPGEKEAAARAASLALADLSSLGPSSIFIAYGAQDVLADDAR
jgi:acetyl esterase/lipase